jgi:hypothetical protein
MIQQSDALLCAATCAVVHLPPALPQLGVGGGVGAGVGAGVGEGVGLGDGEGLGVVVEPDDVDFDGVELEDEPVSDATLDWPVGVAVSVGVAPVAVAERSGVALPVVVTGCNSELLSGTTQSPMISIMAALDA